MASVRGFLPHLAFSAVFARVVVELFELSPIVREHVSDLILADLTEELHRHGRSGKDAARMAGVVQRHWHSERG